MIEGSRNLQYYLLSGPVSLQSFRILERRQLEWHGFRISFYALAVSHAVTLEYEDEQLTEFLSCVPVDAAAKVITEATSLSLPWEVASRVSAIDYSCRLSMEVGGDDGFRYNSFDGENQIAATYPIKQGLPTPVTRLGWRLQPGQIYVETVHGYPEEDRIIRSESVFRFSPIQV